MKKFYLFSMISLMMLFGILPRAQAQTIWNGTADISWYDAAQTSFDISTPEQLAGVAQLVNNNMNTDGITGAKFGAAAKAMTNIFYYNKTLGIFNTFWIAVILCIVSMFTGAMGLFALFMGMFAFWTILTSKLAFVEYQDQLEGELDKIQ